MSGLPALQDARPLGRSEIKLMAIKLLRAQGIGENIPDDRFDLFIDTCVALGLNPLEKDVYPVARRTFNKSTRTWEVGAVIPYTNYMYYLKRAERHPQFDGYSAPEFQGEVALKNVPAYTDGDGKAHKARCVIDREEATLSCTINVYRKDRTRPTPVTLWLSEFANDDNEQWALRPRHMLEKCCLAHAFRRAFTEDFRALPPVEEEEYENRLDPVNEIPAPPQTGAITYQGPALASIQTKELLAEKCNASRVRLSDLLSANGLSVDSLTEEAAQNLIAHFSAPAEPAPVDPAKEIPVATDPVPQEQADTPFSEPGVTDGASSDELASELQRKILTLIGDMAEYKIEKFDEPTRVGKSCMKHLNTATVQECRAIPLLEKYEALLRGRVEKFAEGGK